jgi:UDPglucose--hexose-1-phosphate uridylyltransferase
MPELRRHYFLDEYCIIASERRKRPSDFRLPKSEAGDEKSCPFCPGNEELTPPASAVYTKQGVLADGPEKIRNWNLRVFPNLFAAMVPSPSPPTTEWIALPGHGYHEVIVDSPQHQDSPADFSQEQMELLLQAYMDRYAHYRYMSGVNYVSIFKNRGTEAGASLSHSHSQVIAIPIMPPLIKREMNVISAASFCLFCNIAEREAASDRLIYQNDSWVHIAPFYSQAPYETWILPKSHVSNLEEMTEGDRRDLASLLKKALMSMRDLLEDPPYNFMIYQLPSGYHLNIRIQPAISKIAGFERGTGVYINSVPPEQAAAELRQA